MSELTTAPELVEPAPADDTPADPAPAEGQQTEGSPEPPASQTYNIGDVEYDSETLTGIIDTAKNASKMHNSAHEEYTAAKALRAEAQAIKDDEELQELRTVLNTIKRDGGMTQDWNTLRRHTFAPGAPGNSLALAARLEQMETKLGTVIAEKGEMAADDVLGQFAKKHEGMTKEQAVEVGAKFLAETKADQFPEGADMLDQLEYFHWKNYGQQGQADALTAATKTGYDSAIARVEAGHGAELGAPATAATGEWTPPSDAPDNMLASELAALADDSLVFDNDPFS